MTRIIRKRDHGYSRRHKRHHRQVEAYEYATEQVMQDHLNRANQLATLGDQGSSSDTTHNDTHDAWHRVLDAIGALLVYLHLARQRDNDAR